MDYTVSKSDVDDISSDMSVSSEGCDVGGREDVVSQDEADYFDNDQSMQDDGDNYGEHVPIWGGDSEIGAQDFVDYLDDDEEFDDEDDGDVAFEDDEINMDAYETVDNGDNGVRKTEQGGVIHLVHGWTQRAHPNEVGIYSGQCRHLFIHYVSSTYLEILLVPVPELLLRDLITRSQNLSHARSHLRLRQCSRNQLGNTKRLSMQVFGSLMTRVPFWVVQWFINYKAGFTGTVTTWVLQYPFQLGSFQEEKWCFLN
jgi:hypothetical protein